MKNINALINIDDALKLTPKQSVENHINYGNAALANVLCMAGLDKKFVRAKGSHVWDSEGIKYLDFLAGYGAIGLGHNHPRVLDALKKVDELPNMLQSSIGIMAGALAKNLTMITPGDLKRTFFCNSGTEAVKGALKLVRAATGKSRIVYTENSFHGKTMGALSVTGRENYKKPFFPLIPATDQIPFGDIEALEKSLRGQDAAAFIVEPIQGEGGIIVSPRGYLAEARRLCSKYNTLLIIDEIQTGFGRTGRMFACEHEEVNPDVMCIAKVLGGGIMPIGAFITTDETWDKAYGERQKCTLHSSTFGGNTRACAAGIAAIQVVVEEKISEAVAEKGAYLACQLAALKEKYNLIKEVRGKGFLIGIVFTDLTSDTLKVLSSYVENSLSKEYLAGLVAGELFNKHKVITTYTLGNPTVIRLQPPLNSKFEEIDYFLSALDEVMGKFKVLL